MGWENCGAEKSPVRKKYFAYKVKCCRPKQIREKKLLISNVLRFSQK